jgi:hypothetical protein
MKVIYSEFLIFTSSSRGRNAYKIFVGELEGKGSLGRPRCRREDNVTVDIKEI